MQIKREKLFGTDGIRGTPGVYPLTEEMIEKIGLGISRYVFLNKKTRKRPRIVIGKDTRLSGHKIEANLANIIKAKGIDVLLSGIITTPGLSFLTKVQNADMGIMISASHNKASDNGIKFFNHKGHKFSCKEEEGLEDIVFDSIKHKSKNHNSKRKATVRAISCAQSKYVKFLTSTLHGANLNKSRIALDCASGAASPFAKKLFSDLGAKVFAINDTPQGDNINVGGAIDPSFLKALVLKTKADIGVAVDGDGDRGVLVDETGDVLDGDCIIAIITKYLLKKKNLSKKTIVATVMSNYGLKLAVEQSGAKIITANVGDKYVLEALLKHKLNLGGEQSGHIIFFDYLSTPDGLLTALQILRVMKELNIKLSQLCKCITRFPQILINIKVKEKKPFENMPSVVKKLRSFHSRLKNEGRILLRYSGTENLARIMVEGKDKNLVTDIANSLADEIKKEIGEC